MPEEKEICDLCGGETDELYECERCGQNVCSDCTDNNYPYNQTICSDCESSFSSMLETWLENEEPIEWETQK